MLYLNACMSWASVPAHICMKMVNENGQRRVRLILTSFLIFFFTSGHMGWACNNVSIERSSSGLMFHAGAHDWTAQMIFWIAALSQSWAKLPCSIFTAQLDLIISGFRVYLVLGMELKLASELMFTRFKLPKTVLYATWANLSWDGSRQRYYNCNTTLGAQNETKWSYKQDLQWPLWSLQLSCWQMWVLLQRGVWWKGVVDSTDSADGW